MNAAEEFKSYIAGKEIAFMLLADTGGAGVPICREQNGVVEFFD